MLWLAIAALPVLGLATTASPTATPTPAPGESAPLPEIPTSVRVVRSRAAEVRAAAADAVACQPLPAELARAAEPPFPTPLPETASLAGRGKTLGILLPRTEKGYPLWLFTGRRQAGTYTLKPPQGLELPPSPRLSLGEDGSLAALSGRGGFAVYANGVLTGVFDQEAHGAQVAFRFDEVMWCPWPRRKPSWPYRGRTDQLFKEGEEPPLWLRADFDGSHRKVLARVDPQRLDPEFPNPGEWAMGIATRRDGKLWLVGLSSAEVWLASAGGRILRREVLPVRLGSEEDDEEAMKKLEKEVLRELPARLGGPLTDPSQRQPKRIDGFSTARIRVIGSVMTRDNDLVVTTWAMEPARAVISVPADGSPAHCWVVPAGGEPPMVAVTDDALWWVGGGEGAPSRLMYVPWDELPHPEGPPDREGEGAPSPSPR